MTIRIVLPVEPGNWLAQFLSKVETINLRPVQIVNGNMEIELLTSDLPLTIVQIFALLQIYDQLVSPNSLITLYHVREYSLPRQR